MSTEGINQIIACALILASMGMVALAVKEILWAIRQITDYLKRRHYAAPDPSTRIG